MKVLARRIIPVPLYGYGSQVYRGGVECARNILMAMRQGLPKAVLYFGVAPGDDLLCSAVLRELKQREQKPLWMMSNYPELYAGVGDADRVVPLGDKFRKFAEAWHKWRPLIYAAYDAGLDQSRPPQRHIIAELCACAGVKGTVDIRPYFRLTAAEKEKAAWAEGMIAIQSSGLAGQYPMLNKQWYPERFQEVVNRLKGKFKFVQLGSSTDPALTGVTDLRGQTSIRETAAILANCQTYFGNVGFLMHLARAVECPAVVVFGGREAPWQSGYSCNINLYSAVPCAPCWLWNKCDHDRMCMDNITAADAIRAIEEMVHRPRKPLTVDKITV